MEPEAVERRRQYLLIKQERGIRELTGTSTSIVPGLEAVARMCRWPVLCRIKSQES